MLSAWGLELPIAYLSAWEVLPILVLTACLSILADQLPAWEQLPAWGEHLVPRDAALTTWESALFAWELSAWGTVLAPWELALIGWGLELPITCLPACLGSTECLPIVIS